MPSIWTPLTKIHPADHKSYLKLRLFSIYDLRTRGNSAVYARECIFHDEEGRRVHANFDMKLHSKFSVLVEGKVFGIKKPIVTTNKHKLTDHRYKLTFNDQTEVVVVHDDKFPDRMYKFWAFNELNECPAIQNVVMFDLIGKVVLDEPPSTRVIGGKEVKVLDIYLEDLEENRVSCTLWEKYAQQLQLFLEQKPSEPIVAIIQLCKGTCYKEINKASTFFATSKLVLDENNPCILEFKRSLLAKGIPREDALSLSGASSGTYSSPYFYKLRTLEDVCEKIESGYAWVLCTIVGIENYGPWCYISCKQCSRKLLPKQEIFFCDACEKDETVLRYRLKVRVVDATGNVCLMLWDRHCIQVLGLSAQELIKEKGDDTQLPDRIQALIDQKMLFEIEVKKCETNFEQIFSVNRISRDPHTLAAYQDYTPNTQDSVQGVSKKHIETIDLEDKNIGTSASACEKHIGVKRDLSIAFEKEEPIEVRKKVVVKVEKE